MARKKFDKETGVSLAAYPNPASNAATVKYQVDEASELRLALLDLNGNLVQSLDLGDVEAGPGAARLDLSKAADGLYILALLQNSGGGSRPVAMFKLAVVR